MHDFPDETILIIFEHINKITDKRQFLQTCKHINVITKDMIEKAENNIEIKGLAKIYHNCVQKFTMELCHDSYFDKIPLSYFNRHNTVIMHLLVQYGQLELLKFARNNGCEWFLNICSYAKLFNQFEIMAYLKENGCASGYQI